MIKLHELKVYKGSRKRRKVVGRGLGSGHGTFSGRGAKGQNARKSGGVRPGFEGGRQPLIRQIPKLRGFTSRASKAQGITLTQLNKLEEGAVVTAKSLKAAGFVRNDGPVKILGTGVLKKKMTVQVPATAGARAAIEKAGGSVA